MTNHKSFEVIIIGGSYAGLSAAMALGRSLRKVLIIDSGIPCNRQTPHSHNFITLDGETPAGIAQKAKAQVLKYKTVKFLNDLVVSGRKTANGYSLTTESGNLYTAEKLIFATGIKDLMPNIKGFSDCWGISVIHCPYCHGYEFRGQKTGIMANGDRAFHLATMVNNLTDNLTIMTTGETEFNMEQVVKLKENKIKVVETEISEIQHSNGYVENVVFSDGNDLDFQAVYAAIPFTQHSQIPMALGCELTDEGYIKTDMFQKTTTEGIYACGDNATMMRSVAKSVASGNLAGAMLNNEIVQEKF